MHDILFSWIMVTLALVVAAAYLVRAARVGRAKHTRSDADGGSAFLGKPVLEMGYWLFSPVARLLHRLGVTPNMVTGFSLIPGLLAGVAVAFDQFGLACALATFSSLCDLLDGLLAREGKTSSDAGELFDATVDRHVEFFLMGGLVFHYRQQPLMLILSLLALLGAFMVSYTTAKAEALGIEPPRGAMRRAERAIYLIAATGLTPFCQMLTSGSNLFIREAPLVAATIVIALVSNISSAKRQFNIAHQIRARDGANCPRASTLPPEAKPLDIREYRIAAEPPGWT